VRNTLAYYGTLLITVIKSFIVQALGAVIKTLHFLCKNKLERSFLAGISSLAYYLWVKPGAYPREKTLKGASLE
jgi:hypothetical protein